MTRHPKLGIPLRVVAMAAVIAATSSCGQNTAHDVDVPTTAANSTPPLPAASATLPANAILVIGDGFGLGQITLTSLALCGPDGGFAVESAPVTGLMRTWCANRLVTDSAASGTAMATGFKADKRVVGITPDGREPMNLMEAARNTGLATGAITTSGIMDATPAAFTVHNPSRDNEPEILAAMLDAGHDVLIGAHWHHDDASVVRTALERAEARGVTVARTEAELAAARAPLVGLFDPRPDSPEAGGPPLATSVALALDQLAADGRRFILLVESEETDEHGHSNDTAALIRGAEELDRAVRAALAVAARRGDTLVVVTADHETGGGAVTGGDTGSGSAEVRWLSRHHTGTWVPVFAFGPGAEAFSGVYDNTYLGPMIAQLLGLEGLPAPSRTAG